MTPLGFSFGGGSDPLCTPPKVCYSPAMIKNAYDFLSADHAPTGAGQTIVIVEPYGSASIQDDLSRFDAAFDLPPPPSLEVVEGAGAGGTGSGDITSWGVETSATVEWAHAIAPGANLALVVSPTDDVVDVVATEAQLLPQFPGAIVAQTFGDDETDPTAQDQFRLLHHVFVAATAQGATILASAGDFGATDGGPTPVASYPASDPLVTGVGGTEGNAYPGGLVAPHGAYGGEQVWNESDTFGAATGGAPSVLFSAPSYQQHVTGNGARTVPDVAYNAAINGGIQVFYGPLGFITFGGTSAAVPQWAGIFALADELRAAAGEDELGAANPALYAIAGDPQSYQRDFHDIVVGNNALDGEPGYDAGPGYDLATGLGTPDVANLLDDLAAAASDGHASNEAEATSTAKTGSAPEQETRAPELESSAAPDHEATVPDVAPPTCGAPAPCATPHPAAAPASHAA